MSLLFVAQMAKFGLLAISPLAARSMSKTDWGGVVIAQAIFLWVSLIVEYGFNLYGIQEGARHPFGEIWRHRTLASTIYSGRLIVAAFVTLLFIAYMTTGCSLLRVDNGLLTSALIGGVAYGISPVWHFQLTNRLHLIALGDIFVFGLATVCSLLVVVTNSSTIWMLVGQALGAIIATAWLTALLVKELGPIALALKVGRQGLRRALSLFIYNISIGMYAAANLLVVGSARGISEGASYANSERIIRIVNSIGGPAIKTLFPKFTQLFNDDPKSYHKHFKQSLAIAAISFGILTPILYFAADHIVILLYGDAYADSGQILKVLSLSVLTVNLNSTIGYFWMLPQGLNRAFNSITIAGAVVNASMLILSTRYHVFDYAWSIVITEAFVLTLLSLHIRRSSADLKRVP